MNGDDLRVARKALGLTQDKIAEELGVSRNTYARYEMPSNGGRYPVPRPIELLMLLWVQAKEASHDA